MRFVLLTLALGVGAYAQNTPPAPDASKPVILVQGVVVDKESRAPIADATLSLNLTSFPSPDSPSVNNGSTKSGPSGDFQMRLNSGDNLNVSAQARGYQSGQTQVRGITAGQASVYVEVGLLKLQSVRGALVDDETRKPIAGLAVELVAYRTDLPGAEILLQGQRTASGPDGRFYFPEVSRADYYLRISGNPPPTIGEIPANALAGDGRDKALEPPEGVLSYGTIMWPRRNADMPAVPGITVGATPIDLGETRLSKKKLQSISGLIAPCEEGSTLQIMLARASTDPARGLLATRDLACGSGFQILNLPDGEFTVSSQQGFPQRRWVSQSIDSHTRSPMRLTLAAFVNVQIGVEVDGGATELLPESIRFTLTPENRSVKVDTPSRLRAGAYEATLYPGEHYVLSAAMPAKYYIKRLVYGGSTLADISGFTASAAPISQLTVVVSDQAAAINVRVKPGGNPSQSRSTVILVRDGMSFAEFFRDFSRYMRATDASGSVSFGGLGPGTYRAAMQVDGQPLPTLEPLFQSFLAEASRQSTAVTVDEGQTATIELSGR